ncbi:hypothetical protein KOW79_008668 [Hemibagrus wyckioides]|uniref:Uncharacterized protein n=1 Tax=Hemibagrus wyckioides TaxID=337641 RepID=A0A9D3NUY6_9TELE|nr:hypothetical protein KOW79_008668 [Hemibagrus wyckioides]
MERFSCSVRRSGPVRWRSGSVVDTPSFHNPNSKTLVLTEPLGRTGPGPDVLTDQNKPALFRNSSLTLLKKFLQKGNGVIRDLVHRYHRLEYPRSRISIPLPPSGSVSILPGFEPIFPRNARDVHFKSDFDEPTFRKLYQAWFCLSI